MAWRPRSSWLSAAPAPQARAARRSGTASPTRTRRLLRLAFAGPPTLVRTVDRTRLHRQHDAVMAGIGASIEAVRMDPKGMHGGKAVRAGAADDLVSLCRQLPLDTTRDAIGHVDGIAGSGEARRAHRLYHGHVEVDGIQEHLEDAHGDLGRPRRTDHDVRTLALEHDGRHDGAEACLARGEAACPPRPRVEHTHAAVVHEAEAFGDHARGHPEGMRHGDAVTFAVEHGHVRRVATRRAARVEARDLHFLPGPDLLGDPRRIVLAREPLHRNVDEARVAHVAVLVDGGPLHRLGHHADVLDRVVLERAQSEALEDVQHLDEHHPAPGRLIARDAVTAIGAPQWRVAHRLPLAQVGRPEQAVVATRVFHDGLRDLD